MSFHQSYVFLQDLSNSFIVGSTFYSSFRSANNSWWCFSSPFSTFEDRRRVSLKSCSILFEIQGSSLMPSSHNCFWLWKFFSPIRSISGVFSVWFSEGHHFRRFLHSKFSASFSNYSKLMSLRSSPYSSGASFKYSLISSWSLRPHIFIFPQVSSFVLQFFTVNCVFAMFILNSYGGSFKISLHSSSYQFIHSFIVSKSHRWYHQYLLKFMLYPS